METGAWFFRDSAQHGGAVDDGYSGWNGGADGGAFSPHLFVGTGGRGACRWVIEWLG